MKKMGPRELSVRSLQMISFQTKHVFTESFGVTRWFPRSCLLVMNLHRICDLNWSILCLYFIYFTIIELLSGMVCASLAVVAGNKANDQIGN